MNTQEDPTTASAAAAAPDTPAADADDDTADWEALAADAAATVLAAHRARPVPDFQRARSLRDAARNWDLFYKRNAANFFRDRHWTWREFQELLAPPPAAPPPLNSCEDGRAGERSGRDTTATEKEPDDGDRSAASAGTPGPRARLLEVGCGAGNFIYPLLEQNPDIFVYACDFSPRAVGLVREHPMFDDARVHAFVCDITEMPLTREVPPESLDIVSAIFCLSAIPPTELEAAVQNYDIVISLIPYIYHAQVIKAAVKHGKHVVTTSYVSPAMAEFHDAAVAAGVTVFNEIGVDPGIDHLYAIKMIDDVHKAGGKITSFTSFCGGLPAPECSNNPLGYKFSWSSRGVLLALRNTARYIDAGREVEIPGPLLMRSARPIPIYPAFAFVGYPNRDSTGYGKRYNIPESQTVIRGTLRYQGFPEFIEALVKLGFLDDKEVAELSATAAKDVTWAAVKAKAELSGEKADNIIYGMKWLGMFSETAVHRRGTMLDTLCATLEEKMQYGPGERDMVMLQHRFGVEFPSTGKKEVRTSTGLWFGVPDGDSAMATTVGVPCGIATQLILDGGITRRGVLAPMDMELVTPLLEKLEAEGIRMVEEIIA
ncbi:saccharopine dehydrogenase (NADP+, L-glutamate-forming) [Cladochytrium tenue]|nr:saccharopine dehydrogenase (NADP+, L-glutamate-forming) [Cladochytrium tenue]